MFPRRLPFARATPSIVIRRWKDSSGIGKEEQKEQQNKTKSSKKKSNKSKTKSNETKSNETKSNKKKRKRCSQNSPLDN